MTAARGQRTVAPPQRRAGSVSGTVSAGRAWPRQRQIAIRAARGAERGRLLKVTRGLGVPPQSPQRGAEILVGPRQRRIQLDGPREGGDCLVHLALVVEHGPEVEVRLRPVWPQLHDPAQGAFCVGVPRFSGERSTEIL